MHTPQYLYKFYQQIHENKQTNAVILTVGSSWWLHLVIINLHGKSKVSLPYFCLCFYERFSTDTHLYVDIEGRKPILCVQPILTNECTLAKPLSWECVCLVCGQLRITHAWHVAFQLIWWGLKGKALQSIIVHVNNEKYIDNIPPLLRMKLLCPHKNFIKVVHQFKYVTMHPH